MDRHGFTLVRERALSEVGGVARLWRHDATGAELLSVLNDDENKTFGVTFRTPVSDGTGVPHIIEHSVLCGSEKYTVKEPFVTLLKNSLQTFLNAMTFPDKTCYPVASANLQDFRNLVDVYLDAVFFPALTENTFRQEGWHLEPDADDPGHGPLSFKGVVFNEMKGVYSSPDELLGERSQQALFPGHPYASDYGGDPRCIPTLTYDAFRAFHAAFYHPSNAFFFFWGDDPEEGRFGMLEPYLNRFVRQDRAPEIPLMRLPSEASVVTSPYSASEEDDRAHMTVNWLLAETGDSESMLVLSLLSHILLGLPGSPLRKALIESGLGEDVSGTGLDMNLRQAFFSVGLRSVLPADVSRVRELVLSVLSGLARDGIPARDLEAALNSVEFALRENNTGSYPRGLSTLIGILPVWLHGGDPVEALAWEAPLAALKARIAAGEPVFTDMLRRYFLDVPPTTVVLLPDKTFESRQAAEERERLDALAKAMTAEDRRSVVVAAEALHEAQLRPDAPEDVATVPALTPSDLARAVPTVPTAFRDVGDVHVLTHDLHTNGIVYVSLLLPLDAVPEALLPLLPLYGRALTEMGTRRRDFVELGARIASLTGGLAADALCVTHERDLQARAYLRLEGKAVPEKVDALFDLMHEVLFDATFDDRERFALMTAEASARMEQELVPMGHAVVAARLLARDSVAGGVAEATSGISNRRYLKRLTDRVGTDWEGVLGDLRRLHALVVRRPGAVVNVTADAAGIRAVLPRVAALTDALPGDVMDRAVWRPAVLPRREALIVPAQVNFVGAAGNLAKVGYVWNGAAGVVARHIRMDWLWNNVRVKGGAYGASMRLDRVVGSVVFSSYRDPNIEESLKAYRATGAAVARAAMSRSELDRLIVGTIGDIDTYKLPDAKGNVALLRYLCGTTEETRQRLRDEVFSASVKSFAELGDALTEAMRDPDVCVMGGARAAAVAEREGWTKETLL